MRYVLYGVYGWLNLEWALMFPGGNEGPAYQAGVLHYLVERREREGWDFVVSLPVDSRFDFEIHGIPGLRLIETTTLRRYCSILYHVELQTRKLDFETAAFSGY